MNRTKDFCTNGVCYFSHRVACGWLARCPRQHPRAVRTLRLEIALTPLSPTVGNLNPLAAYARASCQFMIGAPLMGWNSRPCDLSTWLRDRRLFRSNPPLSNARSVCDPRRRFLGLLSDIVAVALGDVRSGWKRLVRSRSVQSNAAVDDQLRAGDVARILRE